MNTHIGVDPQKQVDGTPSLSPLPPFPFPPLRSRPHKSSYSVWGALYAAPAGSGAEPQPKLNLVHFSLKTWHLVATIFIIFMRIKWLNLTNENCSNHAMNTVCISTQMSTQKNGGQNTGRPLHFKKSGGGNVPLSTHGSTPMNTHRSLTTFYL